MQAVVRDLKRALGTPLSPGLYIVATPIGNLADVSLRALAVLAAADVIYCEDTRHSAKLLHHFGISAITRPFHEHNEDAWRGRVLDELAAGKRIALISDAGTPLVSDPGFKLVREAAAAGHAVLAIPGASAVLAALTVSGLPTDTFLFAGFLPPRQAARRARLAELKEVPGSLVLFEAPQRLAETLADAADVLGPRAAAMARELTKLHEEIARGQLADLARDMALRDLKGEVVVVIGPPVAADVSDEAIMAEVAEALTTMRVKDAAKAVSDALNVPRARVYALALKVKDGGA